jgi:NAD(P)-dependent dehydrogenase (short-subunit alcohol dehydrogenase family)
MSSDKVVAFLGASTGIGLSALKHTLAAGHQCIALCRDPSKLIKIFPSESTPNLKVIKGNAHDVAAVSQCIQADGRIVDVIVTTIGAKPIPHKMTVDDPDVCKKGAATLLDALAQLRSSGIKGSPYIIACSTAGFSRFGRDIPLAMRPIYALFVRVPGADKVVMEDRFANSGEKFTIVRPSHLGDGESSKTIRVGIEDPKTGPVSDVTGYSISREDAGKWLAENLVLQMDTKYLNKNVLITY